MDLRFKELAITLAVVMAASPLNLLEGQNLEGAVEAPTYSVQCEDRAKSAIQCKVDKDTYIGWRTYHSACNHCHAQDAVGSSFAPSLVDGPAATIDYSRFTQLTNDGFRGQIGVMPAFKDNPNINTRIDSIYRYLKARSDGVLPRGRPNRIRD